MDTHLEGRQHLQPSNWKYFVGGIAFGVNVAFVETKAGIGPYASIGIPLLYLAGKVIANHREVLGLGQEKLTERFDAIPRRLWNSLTTRERLALEGFCLGAGAFLLGRLIELSKIGGLSPATQLETPIEPSPPPRILPSDLKYPLNA